MLCSLNETDLNDKNMHPILEDKCVSVCLSVLYAFVQNTCQCSQTWQESSSYPGEGRELLSSRKL